MNYWSLRQVQERIGGYIVGNGDITPKSLSIDTRTIQIGDCFVAIRGQRDGHLFADNAVASGASALLVDHQLSSNVPQLIVDNTLKALQRWGQARLQAVRPSLVFGVTGSVGKTSAKNLLAAATGAWKTPGNRNNTLGLPEALATLPAGLPAAVLEMGISTPGEMELLVRIAPPDFGLLTNIGISHIGNFDGQQEGIAKAKGEMIKGLTPGGAWTYLTTDFWANWLIEHFNSNKTLAVAVGPGAKFHWKDVLSLGINGEQFTFCFPGGEVPIKLRLCGAHQIANASLAAAIAIQAGFDPQLVASRLMTVEPEQGRGRSYALRDGGWLLDETYNANYDSIMACARYLLDIDGGKPVAVLGCVVELGSKSEQIHWQIGHDLKTIGIEELWVYGDYAKSLAQGFGRNARAYVDYEALRDDAHGLAKIDASYRVLVKGSRFWAAERVVSWLVKHIGS